MSTARSRRLTFLVLALSSWWGTSPSVLASEGQTVTGTVEDALGAPVAGARVTLVTPQQAIRGSARTDAAGRFAVEGVRAGRYRVKAEAPGLTTGQAALTVGRDAVDPVAIVLEPHAVREEVTVTAHPGQVESAAAVSQPTTLIDGAAIGQRAKSVVAQIANEAVGIHLQRTSTSMSGIFVRGLTGNKVNVFVDGVRYSNAAARGGVNTFLNLVDPESLEAVEVLRGPHSAGYGSDALGGSVQFLTRSPSLSADGARLQGTFGTTFNSSDLGYGSSGGLSYGTRTFGIRGGLWGRRVNTLRPGQGLDSHNAVTRFLGLSSDLVLDDGRLPDTAFTQYGGMAKANWALSPTSQVLASYTRGQQDGGKRYDQLLGGDGNLVADLRNLMMDRATVKYERFGLGFVDQFAVGYAFTSQREERVNQGGNGNPRAAINHEYERTNVHGVQVSAVKVAGHHSFTLGADGTRERVNAPSFGWNPVSLVASPRRPRVPDEASYSSGGVFLQDVMEAVPGRLRLVGNLRYSGASYRARAADSPLVNGRPLWPDDSLDVADWSFRAGAVVTPTPAVTLTASVARGFRAPHVTDLGTLGLTGAGFEVAAPDVAGLGATVGTTAGSAAVSTGDPVRQVGSEISLDYELGFRYHTSRLDSDLSVFQNDIDDNIAKQALVLPAGAVGVRLGDQPIVRQTADGVVFVGASASPVLVRANFDTARVFGIEHTLVVRPAPAWSVSTVFTYLHAKDRKTGLAPNIEGGTPATDGYLKVRYAPGGRRYWVEPYLHAAARQSRLSSLDLEDRRTGAGRSRASIASFFGNGARARGLIGPGADGTAGNADDVLLATGETLPQVQDRVLGVGVASSSLHPEIPGYVTFGLRGGARFGSRHEVLVDFENIGDRNYRGISWGVDAPGRGLYVRYALTF